MADNIAVPAGDRPHKLIVQGASDARDNATGEINPSFSALDPVRPYRYGAIEPLSGRELTNAREIVADVTHRVRIGWDSKMAAAHPRGRILFGSRIFEIIYVLNIQERNVTLQFLCREKI